MWSVWLCRTLCYGGLNRVNNLAWMMDLVRQFEVDPFPSSDAAFVRQVIELGADPAGRKELPGEHAEALLWMLQHGLADVIWSSDVPLDERRAALGALPGILRSFEATAGVALHHFWLGVLDLRELLAKPGSDSESIIESVLSALAGQLEMESNPLQLSALNGLREVGGPRTREIVTAAWDKLVDDEVRSYAE